MKKYGRVSGSFLPMGAVVALNKDEDVNEELNRKLQDFIQKKKIKDYRIVNVETVLVPSQDFSSAYNLVCLHLEYEA